MAIPTDTNTYGKVIPPKAEREVTLKDRKLQGFKYPLEASPGNGYYSKQSGLGLVKSNLKALLRTQRGERFMLPDFGCDVRKFIFEPLDKTTFNLIKEDIEISIRKYLKIVNIEKLIVYERRGTEIEINLLCSLKDAQSTKIGVGVRL